MTTHIAIDRLAMQACLFNLAKAIAIIELRDGSAIHIKLAVAALTEGNPAAEEAWKDAQDDLARHMLNLPARNKLREEFGGRRIVGSSNPEP